MFQSAIGILPYEMVPAEWKEIFYDRNNELQAYELFDNYLKSSHYSGAAVGDWVKDNYNILLSMYADFKAS